MRHPFDPGIVGVGYQTCAHPVLDEHHEATPCDRPPSDPVHGWRTPSRHAEPSTTA